MSGENNNFLDVYSPEGGMSSFDLGGLGRRASTISDAAFSSTDLTPTLLQNNASMSGPSSMGAAGIPALNGGRKGSISKSAPKLYALRIASQPGIYHSWALAKTLIEGCPGAKYKGFVSVEECMQFIWEGFPQATFTPNEQGDYIMDDPEPVFKVIEEARKKKEKNSGLLLEDDLSFFDATDSSSDIIATRFQQDSNMSIALNEEQSLALDLVKKSNNVFISGARKTGKDVLMSHVYAYLSTQKKSFLITSASVITSQNSNATFTLGWTGMGKAVGTKKQILSKVRKNTQARKTWCDVDVLIIKECSMLSAFLLDIIDYLAREIRKAPSVPFGGIQIILVGDTNGYLPPPSQTISCPQCGQNHRIGQSFGSIGTQVGGFITCNNEECKYMFTNSWILYPFESSVWDDAKFHYIRLSTSFEADEKLAAMYQDFSKEPPFSERSLELLKAMMEQPRRQGQVTAICANNEEMNRMNESELSLLPGEQVKYEALDTVLNNFDFSSRAQQKDGPCDEIICLKPNTQILIISENGRSVTNAQVLGFAALTPEEREATATKLSNGMPQVKAALLDWISKNPMLPKVRLASGEVTVIHCRVWIIRSNGRAAAWRIQLPIRLAYALSLAKGQELELENMSISAGREWLSGEMYMGLGLAKDFAAVSLDGVTETSFTADPRVLSFLKNVKQGSICLSVKTNTIPEGFMITPPSSLKRHSVAVIGGVHKKRRPSKTPGPFMPSFKEDSNEIGNNQMVDPHLLRYQQMSQRRHSYQPLSSYQEQQFSFLQQSQNSGMMPSPNHMMSSRNNGGQTLLRNMGVPMMPIQSMPEQYHHHMQKDPFSRPFDLHSRQNSEPQFSSQPNFVPTPESMILQQLSPTDMLSNGMQPIEGMDYSQSWQQQF